MTRAALFILFSVFILGGCRSQSQSAGSVSSKDSLLAGIERGACFGACPEFKAVIYKSGFAEYHGRRNAPRTGYHTAQLSPHQLSELKDLISNYHMEEKDSAYVNKHLADFPSFTLWVGNKKPSRKIFISDDQPDAELMEFTGMLERIIAAADWKLKGRDDQ